MKLKNYKDRGGLDKTQASEIYIKALHLLQKSNLKTVFKLIIFLLKYLILKICLTWFDIALVTFFIES